MTIKRIVVAHDFSAPADRALAFAAELARSTGAALEVVHVHPDVYDGHSEPSLGIPWPTEGQEERYLRFLEQELLRAVRAVLGDEVESVRRHVVRGDPVKRVQAVTKEVGGDLICVGSTGKGAVERLLLGSVSQLILRTSDVPVLIVH